MKFSSEDFLTTEKLAERLGVSKDSLFEWKKRGAGPPYIQCGRYVRYPVAEVEEWIQREIQRPRLTADVAGRADLSRVVEAARATDTARAAEAARATRAESKLRKENLLCETELAAILRVKRNTVASWRVSGTGPKFLCLAGHTIRYHIDDVNAWIESQRRDATDKTKEPRHLIHRARWLSSKLGTTMPPVVVPARKGPGGQIGRVKTKAERQAELEEARLALQQRTGGGNDVSQ